MVQSIYDNSDYQDFYNIQPIRRINNDQNGYDLIAFGSRLGVGFVKDGKLIADRPMFDLDVKGNIRCVEFFMVSDERKKENIRPVAAEKCGDLVSAMNVRSFTFKDDPRHAYKYGFIAQELERVSPELVRTDADGNKSVDITQVVALLCGAVQDLQKQRRGRRMSFP